MMQPTKHCHVQVENETILVIPMSGLGELDCEYLSEDMDGVLCNLQQQRARHVVIDFCHTQFFCSDLIYLLLKIHRRVKEQQGWMALCGLSSYQREVLSLMVLDQLWPLCDSQAEALAWVARQSVDLPGGR
ncbi:MAG: STAS domain-containing protein [Pirellulaceae bacterium]